MHVAVLHGLAAGLVFAARNGDWIRKDLGQLFRPQDLEILGWDHTVLDFQQPAIPEIELAIFHLLAKQVERGEAVYWFLRANSIGGVLRMLKAEEQRALLRILQEFYP